MSHAVHTSSIHYRESVRKHNDLVMSPAGRGGGGTQGQQCGRGSGGSGGSDGDGD